MADATRMKTFAALVVAALAVACLDAAGPAPARPVTLTRAQSEAVLKEIAKDRADTMAWLKADKTSYLATIDRRDFGDRKTLTVGRAPDNDVRIDDPAMASHHLRVTVVGEKFHVEALDASARFTAKKTEQRDATLDPSYIEVDRFTLRLSHQGFPALIVFDPKSPRFKVYKGIEYFPPDLAYRYELPLTPNPSPDTVTIQSTRGNVRRATRVGWFDFLAGGMPSRLEVVRLLEPGVGENDLGVFFRDATTGKESYPVGRYVDVKKLPNGRYLLDFNLAYNPACAYSDHYNCPIPPKANVLRAAIRAGERDAHYQH